MEEHIENIAFPYISESFGCNCFTLNNNQYVGEGIIYRVYLDKNRGYFIGAFYDGNSKVTVLEASGNYVHNETEKSFYAEQWKESNIQELIRLKLNTNSEGVRPFWHLDCEEVECLTYYIFNDMQQDSKDYSRINFIPTYNNLADILEYKTEEPNFDNKDFLITALYISPKNKYETGHFVTGVLVKKGQRGIEPFVYDTDNNGQKNGQFKTEDGRIINYSHLNALPIQGKSNLCGIFTAVAIPLMTVCENFGIISTSCKSGDFQRNNYNYVKDYLKSNIGIDLDYFVSNRVIIDGLILENYGASKIPNLQTHTYEYNQDSLYDRTSIVYDKNDNLKKMNNKKSKSQFLKNHQPLEQAPLKPKAKEMEDMSHYWRNRINKKDKQLASYEIELQ